MRAGFRIKILGSHDRASFRSGVEALDRYLREQVTQDIRRRLSNCFVALDAADEAIAGYYTFAAASVPLNELPPAITRRLPRYPSLPAGVIRRLAVDQRFQRQGLGSLLIVDAAARAMRAEPAIYALVVEAKDKDAAAFYTHLGFQPFLARPLRLFIPISEMVRRLAR